MIASKSEIKSLAFGNNFDINAIKDSLINLVELQQLKPLLGSTLFKDLQNNPANYGDLLGIVKPFLAYYIKVYVNDPNHYKTGNKGSQTANGSNETQADPEKTKRSALKIAEGYKNEINIWLKSNGYIKCKLNNEINKIIIL